MFVQVQEKYRAAPTPWRHAKIQLEAKKYSQLENRAARPKPRRAEIQQNVTPAKTGETGEIPLRAENSAQRGISTELKPLSAEISAQRGISTEPNPLRAENSAPRGILTEANIFSQEQSAPRGLIPLSAESVQRPF